MAFLRRSSVVGSLGMRSSTTSFSEEKHARRKWQISMRREKNQLSKRRVRLSTDRIAH
jgi:hypothetical protein